MDIVAFGAGHRTDRDLSAMRRGLYDALHAAFADSDIDVDSGYATQDRGDGALYVMPPTIPPVLFIDPFVDELQTALREYNRHVTDAVRIKLRMALHMGTVHFDEYGVTGRALTKLFTLLEAPGFKTVFGGLNTDLGCVVSDRLYDDVIRHAPGLIDPAEYRPVEVNDDADHAEWGWMHFPRTAEVFSFPPQPVRDAQGMTPLVQRRS